MRAEEITQDSNENITAGEPPVGTYFDARTASALLALLHGVKAVDDWKLRKILGAQWGTTVTRENLEDAHLALVKSLAERSFLSLYSGDNDRCDREVESITDDAYGAVAG